jgi:hypothetical protein
MVARSVADPLRPAEWLKVRSRHGTTQPLVPSQKLARQPKQLQKSEGALQIGPPA